MPARLPLIANRTLKQLEVLGQQIRAHRKALKINATTAAEAAGVSRVTFYRIEKGESSVTVAAYLNAIVALGLTLQLLDPKEPRERKTLGVRDEHKGWIPIRVRMADYPRLKQLAWQVHGLDDLSPREAFSIYERNRRHIDGKKLTVRERNLMDALRSVFGESRGAV